MAVSMQLISTLILFGIFVVPPLIAIVGFFALMRFKRKIKLLVRKSDKEYLWKIPTIYGKKISTKLQGKEVQWIIQTSPDAINTFLGLVPFYYAECGKPTTSPLNISKSQSLTETELRQIENQAVLSTLLKTEMFGKEGIMLLIGAVGIGAVLGIILGKLLLFKQV